MYEALESWDFASSESPRRRDMDMESDSLPMIKGTHLCAEADESHRKGSIRRMNVLVDIELRDLNLDQTSPNPSRSHSRRILDPGQFLRHATHL